MFVPACVDIFDPGRLDASLPVLGDRGSDRAAEAVQHLLFLGVRSMAAGSGDRFQVQPRDERGRRPVARAARLRERPDVVRFTLDRGADLAPVTRRIVWFNTAALTGGTQDMTASGATFAALISAGPGGVVAALVECDPLRSDALCGRPGFVYLH